VTQAICADILRFAIVNLEEEGYPVVFHVHDECIAEMSSDFGSLKEMEQIMERVPPWAKGFPIKAEGWEGKRFRK
jgi:DNA polymerase